LGAPLSFSCGRLVHKWRNGVSAGKGGKILKPLKHDEVMLNCLFIEWNETKGL